MLQDQRVCKTYSIGRHKPSNCQCPSLFLQCNAAPPSCIKVYAVSHSTQHTFFANTFTIKIGLTLNVLAYCHSLYELYMCDTTGVSHKKVFNIPQRQDQETSHKFTCQDIVCYVVQNVYTEPDDVEHIGLRLQKAISHKLSSKIDNMFSFTFQI